MPDAHGITGAPALQVTSRACVPRVRADAFNVRNRSLWPPIYYAPFLMIMLQVDVVLCAHYAFLCADAALLCAYFALLCTDVVLLCADVALLCADAALLCTDAALCADVVGC